MLEEEKIIADFLYKIIFFAEAYSHLFASVIKQNGRIWGE